MAKGDYIQYSFRLNLNNPNHLKIYRTFTDLNTDIHKSRTNFIIEALLDRIGGFSSDRLTNAGAKEKSERQGYVTRKEFDEMESRVTAKVMKEVAEFMSKAAMANQGIFNSVLIPPYMQMMQERQKQTDHQNFMDKQYPKEENTADEPMMDSALEEMAVLFANGKFGEE